MKPLSLKLTLICLLRAYAFHVDPDVLVGTVNMCIHSKRSVKHYMHSHAAINGLETLPLPDEFRNLDHLSLQIAKAFQTIVRHKT